MGSGVAEVRAADVSPSAKNLQAPQTYSPNGPNLVAADKACGRGDALLAQVEHHEHGVRVGDIIGERPGLGEAMTQIHFNGGPEIVP